MTTTPEPGTTEAGEQDDGAVYVITSEPGPHVEFIEMETADGRGLVTSIPYAQTDDNRWRIGPLYPAAVVESLQAQLAAALAERDELSEKVAVLNADYDRLYREHVVPLRAQLEQQRTQTQAAQAVVEAAQEYRRLAHAQEVHEDGCGDNPCETCAVAAGATQEAERALFAALAALP